MNKKVLMSLVLLAIIGTSAVFAQRVGDTVTVNGQNYRIEQVNGDRLVLQKMGKYEVVTSPTLNWAEAKAEAERRGGHLAVITSAQEQQTIVSMLPSGGNRTYWIGGYSETAKVFRWVTGEPMTYTNWAPNQPSENSGGKSMQLWERQGYRWDDAPNANSRMGYIIEY